MLLVVGVLEGSTTGRFGAFNLFPQSPPPKAGQTVYFVKGGSGTVDDETVDATTCLVFNGDPGAKAKPPPAVRGTSRAPLLFASSFVALPPPSVQSPPPRKHIHPPSSPPHPPQSGEFRGQKPMGPCP